MPCGAAKTGSSLSWTEYFRDEAETVKEWRKTAYLDIFASIRSDIDVQLSSQGAHFFLLTISSILL